MALADLSDQFSEGELQQFRQLIDNAMQASSNILSAAWQRDTEFGHQSARFIDACDPGSLPLCANSVQALQRLLVSGFDRNGLEVRIRVSTDVTGMEQFDFMPL